MGAIGEPKREIFIPVTAPPERAPVTPPEPEPVSPEPDVPVPVGS
jgi:hypothetical protein